MKHIYETDEVFPVRPGEKMSDITTVTGLHLTMCAIMRWQRSSCTVINLVHFPGSVVVFSRKCELDLFKVGQLLLLL